MASVDIFLQRDASGVADVSFAGDAARLLKDGVVVRDWTGGGVLAGVAAGDGYTLEVRRGEAVTAQTLAIGVVVVAAGQSNMSGWLRSYSPIVAAEHTYSFDGVGGWKSVEGNGAKTYTAVLAQALGVPVAMVDASVSGSPLLEANRNPAGYWLDPDGIYARFQAVAAAIGGKAEVVLWAQGEQDGYPFTSEADYAAGLATLASWFRRDLSPAAIEIIELGRIEESAGVNDDDQVRFPAVRAAQHDVAASDPDVFVGAGSLGVDGSLGLDHANKLHRTTVSYAFEAFEAATALLARYGLTNGYTLVEGGEGNDVLTAGDAPAHVLGRQGDDVIVTGAGDDVIDGGIGSDVIDAGSGDNLVRGDAGDDVIRAGAGTDMLSGGLGDDTIFGGAGGDEIWGDAGNDTLFGEEGSDLIYGGDGDDRLDGGSGNDRMVGGAGNDTYVVGDLNDTVIEQGGQGDDTIEGLISIDLHDFANVENVTLVTGNFAIGDDGDNRLTGNAYSNTLIGNGGADVLDGRGGADTMVGGAGDDTYIVDDPFDTVAEQPDEGRDIVYSGVSFRLPANVEELVLTGAAATDAVGTAAAEAISGNAAANRIDGGGGADRLYGGAGDDTYVVRDAAALVYEDPGAGIDTIETWVDYALPAEVEHLRAMGTAALALTGNALANRLTGNAADNVIDGGAGDDEIAGGGGDDLILGGEGADIALFSGLLAQSQVRRREDGGYVVSGPDGTDVLFDVEFAHFGDGAQYALADLAGIERTSGTEGPDALTGGDGDDVIEGLGGDDRLLGLGGRDTLVGGAGNDWLDGGAGDDVMRGGAGDDFYVVDAAGDVVVEDAGEGVDTVHASITRTLEANVENLVLTGAAAIGGTGNALANVLRGNAAANVLSGGDGADTLDGGAGADTMIGGNGDDTYHVDNAGDAVIEYGGAGTAVTGYDTVRAVIDYALPNFVERLVLEGSADLRGIGNSAANALIGNAGNNWLDGGVGADTMTGGAGDDTYVVDNRSDTIVERPGEGIDTVRTALASYTLGAELENLVYTGAATGTLIGNDLHNVLTGGAGNDVLRGFGGNDTLIGGAGADSMAGGDGDDSYFVDDAGDTVIEYAGAGAMVTGYDTVYASISYVLPQNVEALVLLGEADLSATGNALNNAIYGNAGGNLIDGGFGFDMMAGGAGDDVYFVRDSGDKVIELAGEGHDTVWSTVHVILSDNVEDVLLLGAGAINATGNTLANRITGNVGANQLSGGDGDDVIEGGGGADTLTGGAGADNFVLRSGAVEGVRIADFAAGEDRIVLLGFGQYAEVTVGVDRITIADAGAVQTLLVNGAADVALVAPDFSADNVAPVVGALDPLTATEDAAFAFTLPDGLVSDANAGDWVRVAATLADGAPLPAWLSFDARTQTFSGTPGAGDVGTLAIRLTATDAGGASASAETVLTIAAANDAPVVVAPVPAQEAGATQAFAYTLPAGLFADEDGDTLALAVTLADGSALPAWLSFDAATGVLSGTPDYDALGTLELRVTATDPAGAVATSGFTLAVVDRNHAPVATGVVPAQQTAEGEAFAYTLPAGLFTDADAGDVPVLSIALEGGGALPAWLVFDAATGLLSGVPEEAGALSLVVTATDRRGATAATGFTLTVAEGNHAPVVTGEVPAQQAASDAPFVLTLPADLFSDVDAGDVPVLSVTLADGAPLPAWLAFDVATGTLSGTPAFADAGALVLRVTATDRAGASAHVDVALDIVDRNVPPEAVDSVAAQTALASEAFAFVLPAGLFRDGNAGETLALSATLANGGALPGWLQFDAATGTFSGTPAYGDIGALALRVVATDHAGATAAVDFALSIAAQPGRVLSGGAGADVLIGGTGADTLRGYAGADMLDGREGADQMTGGDGDDTYFVDHAGDRVVEYTGAGTAVTGYDTVHCGISYALPSAVEALVLTGGANIDATGNYLANTLTGNDGDNVLDGMAGADTLIGGKGNDTYVVDSLGDRIVEHAGEGIDTVRTTLTTYTLGAELEQLVFVGKGAGTLNGNALANVLTGGSGADTLRGGGGADLLDGGAGADMMAGGDGDDTYLVDHAGDTVIEYTGTGSAVTGVDTVRASVSFTLGANVENLVLTGAGAIDGTGNSLANRLTGNAAANLLSGGKDDDVLDGGGGADTLIGGLGADHFVFRAGQTEGARIADFAAGQDRIDLVGFGAEAGAVLADGWLTITDGAATYQLRVDGSASAHAGDIVFHAEGWHLL